VAIWVVIWGCHLGVSSGVVILGCHLGLSSGVVIWVVIWDCHLGVVICYCHLGYHLGCHLGCHLVLSSQMTHSPFYLFIENFIHSHFINHHSLRENSLKFAASKSSQKSFHLDLSQSCLFFNSEFGIRSL
jgi:hypothetical protein